MTAVQPIPGPAGSGALGTDVWASQGNPGAVTDWGPIINTLMDNGAKRLLFQKHDFPFSTQISLFGRHNVIFEGEAAFMHAATGGFWATQCPRLIWKGGAGTGKGIDGTSVDGFILQDMGLYWDSLVFDGSLIDFPKDAGLGWPANCHIFRNQIGPLTADSNPALVAKACLLLRRQISGTVELNCIRGAKQLIRGADVIGEVGDSSITDNTRILRNTMSGADTTGAMIMNVTNYWTIEQNEFLFGSWGSSKTHAAIDSDLTMTSRFSFRNNQLWDFADPAQVCLHQRAGNTWDATIAENGFEAISGSATAAELYLQGPGRVRIRDNRFARSIQGGLVSYIDLGPSASALKEIAIIEGNSWSAANSGQPPVSNVSGHKSVSIKNNSPVDDQELTTRTGYDRFSYEASAASWKPSIAASAGQPALNSIAINGNVSGGYITVSTTGANATVAGALADITFPAALLASPNPGGGLQQHPLVEVTPFETTGSTALAAATAVPYGKSLQGQTTGFTIGTKNAVPISTTVSFAYRVVQL